jgi:ParB family transcriptional regulator, chromosome partitioning protein
MSADKKKALGRGLESLIPSARATATAVAPAPTPAAAPVLEERGEAVRQIPVEEIERNPYQPRQRVEESGLEELAASIRSSGIMQPIVLRYIVSGHAAAGPAAGGSNGAGIAGAGSAEQYPAAAEAAGQARPKYQLIAGERRWLAAKKAGLATVPAIVRQCSNEQAMELAIIENLQREDLNPLEQAMAFDRLGREFGLTQEQMARKTGKDRTTISNYVRLLRLPVETQGAITLGQLSFGHAKVMMALEQWDLILDVTKRVLDEALSVRQTEEVVYQMLNPTEKEAKTPKPVDPNVREAERRLEQVLGTRVRIKDRKGRGKVMIEYHTLDDFDRILEALGAGK